jgi:DNA-directed RNA polymerase specialized sigma24 family protein
LSAISTRWSTLTYRSSSVPPSRRRAIPGPSRARSYAPRRAPGAPFEPRALVDRALLLSVERAPPRAFAAIAPEDRGAVALARLAGYSVPEVAAALGVAAATVRVRMLRGLRAMIGSAIEREAVSRDKGLR